MYIQEDLEAKYQIKSFSVDLRHLSKLVHGHTNPELFFVPFSSIMYLKQVIYQTTHENIIIKK